MAASQPCCQQPAWGALARNLTLCRACADTGTIKHRLYCKRARNKVLCMIIIRAIITSNLLSQATHF